MRVGQCFNAVLSREDQRPVDSLCWYTGGEIVTFQLHVISITIMTVTTTTVCLHIAVCLIFYHIACHFSNSVPAEAVTVAVLYHASFYSWCCLMNRKVKSFKQTLFLLATMKCLRYLQLHQVCEVQSFGRWQCNVLRQSDDPHTLSRQHALILVIADT